MKIEWITDWETIYSENFQAKWMTWATKSSQTNVFFHPALCMAWLDTYRPIRNIKPYFAITQEGEKVIFLPMVLWKRNWKNAFQKLLVPVGYSDFDYHDPITVNNEESIVHDFLNQIIIDPLLAKAYDKIYLNGLRTLNLCSTLTKELAVAPFAELSRYKNFEEAKNLLPSKLRGDIRRQIRRLEELGELKFEIIRTLDDGLKILPDFLRHHQIRWPNSYKAPCFHENLIRYGLEKKIVDISILKFNNHIISYHLGFNALNRFYYYMPAIDLEFAKFSPGKIHLYFLFECAYNRGIKIFDHLRGDENYKAGWTDKIQELYYLEKKSSNFQSKIKTRLLNFKKLQLN